MEFTQNQPQTHIQSKSFFRRLTWIDWLYGLTLVVASLFALNRFAGYMDYYEKTILVLAAPTFAWLGWAWKPVRLLIVGLALMAFSAIFLYGGSLDMANKKFFLKYLLSS